MIALLFLAPVPASPGPVLYSAETRSIAYRNCIAAGHEKRPTAPVDEIGRAACARVRSRLVAGVREHDSFGWAATAKTEGQARRLREHLKQEAESQVAAFEVKLQAWLEGGPG
jgi:hypothetical protein